MSETRRWGVDGLARVLRERFSRETVSTRFIPEIDGLRFVAIALVLWIHIGQRFHLSSPLAYWRFSPDRLPLSHAVTQGRFGVQLFFAISGFILGLPFASHWLAGTPRVGLKQYYIRRLTRLEPPFIIAMTIYFLLMVKRHQQGMGFAGWLPHYLAVLGYVHKLVYGSNGFGLSWSLVIEVQFYILAPFLAWIIFRVRPAALRRGILLCVIMAFTGSI
jgi:peptidoglycan/LPS O-acetylase OafA/YrhL